MAGKEVVTSNDELRSIIATFTSYRHDLTNEAKGIIRNAIDDAMPGSRNTYSGEKIFFLLCRIPEFSRASVKYWCDNWCGTHPGEPIMGDESVRKYKKVCVAVADALLEADKQGVKLIRHKEEGKTYMLDFQQHQLIELVKDGTAIEDMIQYLQSLLSDNYSGN